MTRHARWLATLSLLLAGACGQPSRPAQRSAQDGAAGLPEARGQPESTDGAAGAPGSGLDLVYGIDAARPPTQLSLHIRSSGEAVLTLGTSPLPVPTPVLGRFRAQLPPATWQRIEAHVAAEDLLDADRGETATAEGSGSIVLTSGGRRVVLGLATNDAPILELRRLLDETLPSLAAHPVAAVRLGAEARRDGASLVPTIVLQHVGDEPLDLVLCDPDDTVFCAVPSVSVRIGEREVGTATLGRDQMVAAARQGAFPAGRFSFATGRDIRIPLPPVTVPAGAAPTLNATLGLWFAGPGRARSYVRLERAAGETSDPSN